MDIDKVIYCACEFPVRGNITVYKPQIDRCTVCFKRIREVEREAYKDCICSYCRKQKNEG